MSNLSLELCKNIASKFSDFCFEIKIDEFSKQVKLYLVNNTDVSDNSSITINDVNILRLLNGNFLHDNLLKLDINLYHSNNHSHNITCNLPIELKKLKISNINTKLDNLPLKLEVLELYGHCANCSLDYLPSSLKTLVIQSNYKNSIDNLPSTLENLFLLSEYTKDIKNLPQKLKFLHINSQAKINVILPKNIICVMFPEDNNWLRRNFVKSYQSVIYNCEEYQQSIERYYHNYHVCKNDNKKANDMDSEMDSETDSDIEHYNY